jgi:hypothetical protein
MARSTHAWSVTSQGFIVGFYNDQNGTQNGFLCLLGCRSFPVGPWGDLYANSSLEAAGTIFEANNFAFGQLLNIQTGAGAGFELGNYGGGTYVQGINSSGVVVGFYIDNPNQEHAFLFEPNGTWSNGDPPGSNGNAKAMAINDAGAFTGTVGSLGFVTFPEVTPPCCIVAAP